MVIFFIQITADADANYIWVLSFPTPTCFHQTLWPINGQPFGK